MPFWELVALRCQIYLCQENVLVLLLQCLLDQFGVLVILHRILLENVGGLWHSYRNQTGAELLMDRLKSELGMGVCSPCVHEWHWKTTVCCPQPPWHHYHSPVWILGMAAALSSIPPSCKRWVEKTPGTSASKMSRNNLFLFTSIALNPLYVTLTCLLTLWSGIVFSGSKGHHSIGLKLSHWKCCL